MKTLVKLSETLIGLLLKQSEPVHTAHYAQAMIAAGHQQLRLF